MPSFQFYYFFSLGVFNYFLLILGVFIYFSMGGWGFWIWFWPFILSSLWWFQMSIFIVIFVSKNNFHFVNFGGFFVFLKLEGFEFSSFYFGGPHFLLVWKGGGVCSCEFGTFFVLLFWSSQVFNFSCHFVGFRKNIVWSFARGERGVFAFLLVNFKKKLFSYFEVSKFSISLLVILWVFKKKLWEISQGERGVCAFLLVNFESFCFSILKFWDLKF